VIIVYNRKRVGFANLFSNVQLFVDYLKLNYPSLNFENKEFRKKIINAYDFFVNEDEVIQYTRLTRNLHRGFKFKYRNVTKVEFWVERGWSNKEAIDIINLDKLKRIEKQIITHKEKNKKKKELIIDNTVKEFRFISSKFFWSNYPICNECGHSLYIKKVNVNNLENKFYYKIEHCSNVECKTHGMNKKEKYISFLPSDVSSEILLKFSEQARSRSKFSVDSWIKKGYSKEEAKKEISNMQSGFSNKVKNRFIASKENFRNLGYTEDEIREICLTPTQVEFWIKKGFSKDCAEYKIKEHQKNSSKEFAKKRSENPELYSAVTHTQIGYWLNKGFSEEEARVKLSERQKTFSLDICIEKYGEEEGVKVFNERQNKWNKSLNEGGNLKIGYSKCSQDLFNSLINNYLIHEIDDVLFATKGGEFKIQREEGGIWMYDFVDLKRKKIIEYHGDMYHGNPDKYSARDFPHPFRKNITAQEMWDKDSLKIESAENNGFDVLVIWDSEYRWGNKQKIIDKCLNFLEII